ncbi:hypothetical protein MVEN_00188600 [Mycena venus]|uniref:Uncharacterized protein n=1 Tax=Mycena venus TaxID=2733690 RepID=A0A8H6Z1C7_9AGAR|nr:hypothetical protein MVEN_00188600 [Mycena venus]
MSKLEFLKLAEALTPASVHGWLGRCEDTYEAWLAMNPERQIEACVLITLAGLKMEESNAATWWNENCADLKELKTWQIFAQKVKERFVSPNWHMTALAAFYAIQQGSSSFSKFADSLQTTWNALAGAESFALSFTPDPLCISSQNDLLFVTMKVNTLITTMSAMWDSLIAEGIIKSPRAAAPTPVVIPAALPLMSPSLPTPTSASSGLTPLTQVEKEALRAANGCYHCQKTPQTPGWVKHQSDNCPGDAALGILPCLTLSVVASVGPAGFSSMYDGGYVPVAAVMPAYDPKEDSWEYSSGSDDNDLSCDD